MISVLGLSLYGPLAASTRYRLGQYVPGLAKMGINLQVKGLLGDEYLRRRFSGASLPWATMARDVVGRLVQLRDSSKFDLAILYGELFPYFPAWLERPLISVPYIYDMDDAFYLRYQINKGPFTRSFLGDKFDSVMTGADSITAGNRVLAEHARIRNPSVTQLPTVVDTGRYVPVAARSTTELTVGWIGSPSTAAYLPELVEPLAKLGAEGPVNFVVIGGTAPAIPNVNVVVIPWSEDTEVDLINTFDVGVMPLPSDDWARGKCAFKLIQYMACAVPVVASPVGANVDVVTSECGFLASSAQEWVDALRILRNDPVLRTRMGEAGRQRIVEHYSLQTTLPRLAEVIQITASKG